MTPEVWLSVGTVIAAIVAGYFGMRAAGKTAQPSAQDAINAGFTALTQRQLDELLALRKDVDELKGTKRQLEARVAELEEHVDQQEDREQTFKRIIRLLLDQHDLLRLSLERTGAAVPPDPIDRTEIETLLKEH